MDDIVGTLLLNLFYGGRLKAMPPVLRSDDGKHTVIRPLAYVREYETEKFAKLQGYPLAPKGLCGAGENLKRQEIKELMRSWDREFPGRIYNLFMSLQRVSPSHLMDKSLYELPQLRFARSPRGGSGGSARMRARAETEKSYLATMLSIHLTFKRVIWNYENPLHESHRHGRPQGRDHHR